METDHDKMATWVENTLGLKGKARGAEGKQQR